MLLNESNCFLKTLYIDSVVVLFSNQNNNFKIKTNH